MDSQSLALMCCRYIGFYKIITEQFIIKVLHKSVVWVNVQLIKDNP